MNKVLAVEDVVAASATFAGIALLAGVANCAVPEDSAAASVGLAETEGGAWTC
jgi:hypothetical protein